MESRPAWAGRTVGKRGLSQVDERAGRRSARSDDGTRTQAFGGKNPGWGGIAAGLTAPCTARGRTRVRLPDQRLSRGTPCPRWVGTCSTWASHWARCREKVLSRPRRAQRSALLHHRSQANPSARLRGRPGQTRNQEVGNVLPPLHLVRQPTRHPPTARPRVPLVRWISVLR